jgi:hypothetical protein
VEIPRLDGGVRNLGLSYTHKYITFSTCNIRKTKILIGDGRSICHFPCKFHGHNYLN